MKNQIDNPAFVFVAPVQARQHFGKLRAQFRQVRSQAQTVVEQGRAHYFQMYRLESFGKADKRESSRYRDQSTEKVLKMTGLKRSSARP